MDIDCRLAVYGTLAPGRPNHHQVADIAGRWFDGSVRGRVAHTGWGAAIGYPALTLTDAGETIAVQVLESADLPQHWARLDEFEGSDYRRAAVGVDTADGVVEAWIYLDASPAT